MISLTDCPWYFNESPKSRHFTLDPNSPNCTPFVVVSSVSIVRHVMLPSIRTYCCQTGLSRPYFFFIFASIAGGKGLSDA